MNLTSITSGALHSLHDPSSNNDPILASSVRKSLAFDDLARDGGKIADGTVVTTTEGVWKEAIREVRGRRKGDYIVPVFR